MIFWSTKIMNFSTNRIYYNKFTHLPQNEWMKMKFSTEWESKKLSFDFSCHTFSSDSFKTSCLSLRESVFRLEEPGLDRGLAIFHNK